MFLMNWYTMQLLKNIQWLKINILAGFFLAKTPAMSYIIIIFAS